MTYKDEQAQLGLALLMFPDGRFGLRAFRGDVFRVSWTHSYYGTEPMIYTEVLRGEEWASFAKGTVDELLRCIVYTESADTPELVAWRLAWVEDLRAAYAKDPNYLVSIHMTTESGRLIRAK